MIKKWKQSLYKGDIVLVDFKMNEGSEQNGLRPAVVVQGVINNRFSSTTIVCPLTTQKKGKHETHVRLEPEDCGLLLPSTVLCEQIRAIDKSRIRRKLGSLASSSKLHTIEKKILSSIGVKL